MLAFIQRNQVKLFKNQLIPESDPPAYMDRLQFGIEFSQYPDLPTFGVSVDVTGLTTQAQVRAVIVPEIQAIVSRAEAWIQDSAFAQGMFDAWGWCDTEFETDNL